MIYYPLYYVLNIVVDMLTVILARAKEDGQVKGVVPHLIEDGLSILQNAYNTFTFLS